MKNLSVCPLCGKGHLTKKIEHDNIVYKGKIKNVPDVFYVCSFCRVEQSGAKELKENKRIMNEFKKEVDGLLTGKEVFELRVRLGLTQEEASLVFGGGPNAFTKYENNDVTQSESMDKLLRVASSSPSAFNALCDMAGISMNKKTAWEHAFSLSFSEKELEEFAVESKVLGATH